MLELFPTNVGNLVGAKHVDPDDITVICEYIGVDECYADMNEGEGNFVFTLAFGAQHPLDMTDEEWEDDNNPNEAYWFIDVVYCAPNVEDAKKRLIESLEQAIQKVRSTPDTTSSGE